MAAASTDRNPAVTANADEPCFDLFPMSAARAVDERYRVGP
jgi:hypothetical protein